MIINHKALEKSDSRRGNFVSVWNYNDSIGSLKAFSCYFWSSPKIKNTHFARSECEQICCNSYWSSTWKQQGFGAINYL